MADTRLKPKPQATSPEAEAQQTVIRPSREREYETSLLARAERLMGVKPITGRTRPRPGY